MKLASSSALPWGNVDRASALPIPMEWNATPAADTMGSSSWCVMIAGVRFRAWSASANAK
jgi:hypothetical protein